MDFPVGASRCLLPPQRCANLDFCAVMCGAGVCPCIYTGSGFRLSGAVSGGMSWRSSAGRASDL